MPNRKKKDNNTFSLKVEKGNKTTADLRKVYFKKENCY